MRYSTTSLFDTYITSYTLQEFLYEYTLDDVLIPQDTTFDIHDMVEWAGFESVIREDRTNRIEHGVPNERIPDLACAIFQEMIHAYLPYDHNQLMRMVKGELNMLFSSLHIFGNGNEYYTYDMLNLTINYYPDTKEYGVYSDVYGGFRTTSLEAVQYVLYRSLRTFTYVFGYDMPYIHNTYLSKESKESK